MVDFEFLGECQYPVHEPRTNKMVDCGEPAIAKVWWDDYSKAWLVCEKHLDKILEDEKRQEVEK